MNYGEYILSEHWRRLRLRAMRRDGFRCCLCGDREPLQVHHLRYGADLHRVPLGWLMTLCKPCHDLVHCYMAGTGAFLRRIKAAAARKHLLAWFRVRDRLWRPPVEKTVVPAKIQPKLKPRKERKPGFYARNRKPKDHWR